MPALQSITAIFDGHITKIGYNTTHGDWYWTASGTTNEVIGTSGTFNVTLAEGYVIDTASATSGTISNITDTSFAIADWGTSTTVTITSKQSTPAFTFKHFYDVGTIGTGAVKFRHYSQTEPAVLINFTIANTSYQAEQGMTWAQWVASSYNTNSRYYILNDIVQPHSENQYYVTEGYTIQYGTDIIKANTAYSETSPGNLP